MTTKSTLPHWNYMDRTMHPHMDMTCLDRLPTDTKDPVLNALAQRVNEQSERIEDLFIQIECDRLDREESKRSPKKRITLAPEADEEELDEATLQELQEAGLG